jgi:hypothetical protein
MSPNGNGLTRIPSFMKLYYIRVSGLDASQKPGHHRISGLTKSLYFALQLFGLVEAKFYREGHPPIN